MSEPDPRSTAESRKAAEDLSRLWTAASERAFPASIHQPEIYLRTTRLVGAVAQELRGSGRGVDPLLEAWSERGDLVRRVADSDDLLTVDGLDVEVVAGVAFAMRYREVLEEVALDDRLAAFAAAPPGAGWLVLEESGYRPGDPFVPYRRLEADARSGRALLVTTRPDETLTACVHVVEQGFIDLETGRLVARDPDDPGRGTREVRSGEEREALVERLKCLPEGDGSD
ncbi:hypothetical protein OG884_09500 [Streptosporangium sp. NBC_01755]|uniref:hypothetical protein n=1 Tax=unclassified Streptosporangium TaxID=2632669 RepID=UPI002DD90990|nr:MULTISPECIES: hypothetical protein [unclassified Streptosporangium]WSA26443.1 hypothetical protein OIE13_00615 [Streptosporangium sp. NBC_01810]WSD02127.1 hypothetical protein OG884_09500 [Streptosporangium sp. NBC_01755]